MAPLRLVRERPAPAVDAPSAPAADGDPSDGEPGQSSVSFEDVFASHFGYVWHTLRRLGTPSADLEDLAHEVFMRVHAQLAQFNPSRAMRPWLFGFAFRVASDYRRLARHRLEVPRNDEEPADEAPLPDERFAGAEARALVARALDELSWEQRVVFVMHEIDGAAVPEIAALQGIPIPTAYSRLRLARRAFAEAVRLLETDGSDRGQR